ncbi:hypothetical protein M404DRAFT_298399 [Pisolithus tinctorius Marx 270]|uniref:Uncharacterized protein n=1 Tax=Pisolithus tinctorius Marx 270 TaxID=870435 RepID=A0A0C3N3Y9_PISTI|nr:hypothetical protein M404DRAFT_298399 [Pisolithus tinctorius Marx 270]
MDARASSPPKRPATAALFRTKCTYLSGAGPATNSRGQTGGIGLMILRITSTEEVGPTLSLPTDRSPEKTAFMPCGGGNKPTPIEARDLCRFRLGPRLLAQDGCNGDAKL